MSEWFAKIWISNKKGFLTFPLKSTHSQDTPKIVSNDLVIALKNVYTHYPLTKCYSSTAGFHQFIIEPPSAEEQCNFSRSPRHAHPPPALTITAIVFINPHKLNIRIVWIEVKKKNPQHSVITWVWGHSVCNWSYGTHSCSVSLSTNFAK